MSEDDDGSVKVYPREHIYEFRLKKDVPRTGVMLVCCGGNNGSTLTVDIVANKLGLKWTTKEGEHSPNYYGSLTQATTVYVGSNKDGKQVRVPFLLFLAVAAGPEQAGPGRVRH